MKLLQSFFPLLKVAFFRDKQQPFYIFSLESIIDSIFKFADTYTVKNSLRLEAHFLIKVEEAMCVCNLTWSCFYTVKLAKLPM